MAWSDSWKNNHPDWHHITWTTEDNSNLAYLMSPIMKGLYDKMPQVTLPLAFQSDDVMPVHTACLQGTSMTTRQNVR